MAITIVWGLNFLFVNVKPEFHIQSCFPIRVCSAAESLRMILLENAYLTRC